MQIAQLISPTLPITSGARHWRSLRTAKSAANCERRAGAERRAASRERPRKTKRGKGRQRKTEEGATQAAVFLLTKEPVTHDCVRWPLCAGRKGHNAPCLPSRRPSLCFRRGQLALAGRTTVSGPQHTAHCTVAAAAEAAPRSGRPTVLDCLRPANFLQLPPLRPPPVHPQEQGPLGGS